MSIGNLLLIGRRVLFQMDAESESAGRFALRDSSTFSQPMRQ